MNKTVIFITAMLPFSLLLAGFNGCSGGGGYQEAPLPAPVPEPAPAPDEGKPSAPSVEDLPWDGGIALPEERMIVRNGNISLVVDDVADTQDEIEEMAVGLDGWVVSSDVYGEEEGKRVRISIRVPSDSFDEAMAELREMAVRVTSESTSTQDITEEYIDLQSRLKNAQATEEQYLALLERAEDVEDILSIYEALSRIRSEIEQIKGRMQYLEQTSSTSLIAVDLTPAVSLGPVVSPGWSASESLNNAIRGLTTFGQGLGTAFIWVGILSPIWGTVLGITYWRSHRRKNQQKS